MKVEEIAIIGAGPYGLSLAAHLKAHDVGYRIFGCPMHTWRTLMPNGMFLKSEGFASSLSDPDTAFTLGHYCTANGIKYADIGLPVSLETFWRYGVAFQKRFAPEVEERNVAQLDSSSDGFRLTLDNGDVVLARRVVVATGIAHYANLPDELASAPTSLVSHAAHESDPSRFKGQDVIVIGAGASALDMTAVLLAAGASVQLVARKLTIHFHSPPTKLPRPLLDRIRAPMSGIGPGWRSRLCTDAPLLFHVMPERFRLEVVRRHLGPAAPWWIKDQVVGKALFHLGMRIRGAECRDSRVDLNLEDESGRRTIISGDHVIAATGYKVDLARLPFLDIKLRHLIRKVERTPALSASFESSVPGLYFIGVSSASSFGPMMRFAYGAKYTARRLSRHLARTRRAKDILTGGPNLQSSRSTAET
jgi:Pyridine nucleotide-disulphide oxidoreductase